MQAVPHTIRLRPQRSQDQIQPGCAALKSIKNEHYASKSTGTGERHTQRHPSSEALLALARFLFFSPSPHLISSRMYWQRLSRKVCLRRLAAPGQVLVANRTCLLSCGRPQPGSLTAAVASRGPLGISPEACCWGHFYMPVMASWFTPGPEFRAQRSKLFQLILAIRKELAESGFSPTPPPCRSITAGRSPVKLH